MSNETDPRDDDTVVDFDAFWQRQDKRLPPKAVRIFGQVIDLPKSLPLRFELEARRLQRSKADKDIRTLVSILFGDEAYAGWCDGGMHLEQFKVLLAWGPRFIAGEKGEDGEPLTLQQVQTELDEAEAKSGDEDEDADPS